MKYSSPSLKHCFLTYYVQNSLGNVPHFHWNNISSPLMCKIFFTFTGNTVSSITEPSSLTLVSHVDDFGKSFLTSFTPLTFHCSHSPLTQTTLGRVSSHLSHPSLSLPLGTMSSHSLLTQTTLGRVSSHLCNTPLTFPSSQNPPHSHTSLTDDFGKSPSRRTKLMMGGGALSLVMILDN